MKRDKKTIEYFNRIAGFSAKISEIQAFRWKMAGSQDSQRSPTI